MQKQERLYTAPNAFNQGCNRVVQFEIHNGNLHYTLALAHLFFAIHKTQYFSH